MGTHDLPGGGGNPSLQASIPVDKCRPVNSIVGASQRRFNSGLNMVNAAMQKVTFALSYVLRIKPIRQNRSLVMADLVASEELLNAPLPELIENLGLAIGNANKALAKQDIAYLIQEGTIDLNVAINISKETKTGGEAGLKLSAFSVNASYSKTYNFKEEASSRIQLKFATVPRGEQPKDE